MQHFQLKTGLKKDLGGLSDTTQVRQFRNGLRLGFDVSRPSKSVMVDEAKNPILRFRGESKNWEVLGSLSAKANSS
jgi:hypothetical protein